MDKITKSIVFDLVKTGHCIDMITHELGISPHDIKKAMQEASPNKVSNILAEQLASRLPALLELSIKQLENTIINTDIDRRLKAINIIMKAATALAKLKPQ